MLVLEELVGDDHVWVAVVELERRLNRVPGLLGNGSHIIVAARRPR